MKHEDLLCDDRVHAGCGLNTGDAEALFASTLWVSMCPTYVRRRRAAVVVASSLKGPFKCYVTLEGVGGYVYAQALRGGGGGVTSALRNVIFFS